MWRRLRNLKEQTALVLHTLTPCEEKILRMPFGLEDDSEHPLEEVGRTFAVTRKRIRQKEVKKLLATVNGASPVQIRSRCAILLCSVYGLRVGEVCCLRLEDIDCAEERISVRTDAKVSRSPAEK